MDGNGEEKSGLSSVWEILARAPFWSVMTAGIVLLVLSAAILRYGDAIVRPSIAEGIAGNLIWLASSIMVARLVRQLWKRLNRRA